ncbi:hypothetical protein [Curtobacterium sp. Leaf154]|uniref:hypothetical protein n=1 Tax=Curtobacterium sp. Leaf154 TaxID=1736277 RepID=UPI000701D423|nr:hypothetical protein [Curtobacterium sp. Leaf154]KQR32668.1 hypothetical protein ASF75_04740 [Curtobacterium sp. Leaf154]
MTAQNVTLNIVLNDELAAALVSRHGDTEYAEHPERFSATGSTSGLELTDPALEQGSLLYVTGIADAMLLASYEEARGYKTVHLMHVTDGRAVLSSRPAVAPPR